MSATPKTIIHEMRYVDLETRTQEILMDDGSVKTWTEVEGKLIETPSVGYKTVG